MTFIDKLAQAVVQRIQAMSPSSSHPSSSQSGRPRRRSPRSYTKKLSSTSRIVPDAVLPTGPMPEGPWFEAFEDEAPVPLIGEAVVEYGREHSHRTKMTAYQAESAIASFLTANKLHENEPVWVLTREHCKHWRAYLMDVSAGRTSRNKRRPNPVTISKRMKQVQHWMVWMLKKEYISENLMLGLELAPRLVSSARVRKTSFTDEECARIITALLAMPAGDLPRTEFKWLALALMFSGARCGELLMLRYKDVRQVEGYWCFDIHKQDEANRVKNHPSIRLLPVHSQLAELGFLRWVESKRTDDDTARLFPSIYPKGSSLPSLWFSRLLTVLKIKRPEVSLHSCRHFFTVKLAQQHTYPPLQNRLCGHALGSDTESKTYMHGLTFSVKEMSEAIERVRFPIP